MLQRSPSLHVGTRLVADMLLLLYNTASLLHKPHACPFTDVNRYILTPNFKTEIHTQALNNVLKRTAIQGYMLALNVQVGAMGDLDILLYRLTI